MLIAVIVVDFIFAVILCTQIYLKRNEYSRLREIHLEKVDGDFESLAVKLGVKIKGRVSIITNVSSAQEAMSNFVVKDTYLTNFDNVVQITYGGIARCPEVPFSYDDINSNSQVATILVIFINMGASLASLRERWTITVTDTPRDLAKPNLGKMFRCEDSNDRL